MKTFGVQVSQYSLETIYSLNNYIRKEKVVMIISKFPPQEIRKRGSTLNAKKRSLNERIKIKTQINEIANAKPRNSANCELVVCF